jgi:DNA-binding CsgD family transcriptional regulator
VTRVVALSVLGLVRARRGDPGAEELFDEAWLLAEPTDELQRIEPAAAARAEAAWLAGRPVDVVGATDLALELAVGRRASWIVGELLLWRRRAGVDEAAPIEVPEPWSAQLAGDWQRAGALWAELDSPYEAALALADADEQDALLRSLRELRGLGATSAAAIVTRRMRARGIRGVPRGPRPATKATPGGLTRRELQVLALLAEGLRNAEIARRLVLAPRTVEHHVAAILRKLDVETRVQAAVEARRLGLVDR